MLRLASSLLLVFAGCVGTGTIEPRPLWNGVDLAGWHADVPAADNGKAVPPVVRSA